MPKIMSDHTFEFENDRFWCWSRSKPWAILNRNVVVCSTLFCDWSCPWYSRKNGQKSKIPNRPLTWFAANTVFGIELRENCVQNIVVIINYWFKNYEKNIKTLHSPLKPSLYLETNTLTLIWLRQAAFQLFWEKRMRFTTPKIQILTDVRSHRKTESAPKINSLLQFAQSRT